MDDRFAELGWNSFGLFACAMAAGPGSTLDTETLDNAITKKSIQHKGGEDEPPQGRALRHLCSKPMC